MLNIFRSTKCDVTILCVIIVGISTIAHADDVQFNRDVRPILSAHCFHCHGPDDAKREADLRLDESEGIELAFEGGLQKSTAWGRITSNDPDIKMPPAEAHKDLKPKQVETLKKWIAQGAEFEGHWSFIPPTKPDLPKSSHSNWGTNPIDAFILAKLEANGLTPNDEAAKERLIRRVTLDLTGLPPTIKEIDAFLADEAENAYEKVVDRLLTSPHYGERMAVMWMDAARYGDTSVFHADGPRDMWPWRDWVIDAYNNNKSFKDFTVEQLAGDLIPEGTTEQKLASGFLRNNATTDEGGAIAEEFRVDYAVDRVKTTSMVWLGLSMECAQCHNHKYDPITQEEYYQYFAYFNQASDPGMQTRNGNQSPTVDLFDEENLAKAEKLKKEVETNKQEREAYRKSAEPTFQNWVKEASENVGDAPLVPTDLVFYAALDEQAGKEVVNHANEKERGEVKGSVEWKPGRAANAFHLNGSNYIDFPDACDFERNDAFSYGAWIKPDGTANGAPIARMNNGNAYRGYDLLISNGNVSVHIINTWPTNALKVRTKNNLKPDEWQHVFVTYDGSSKTSGLKIFFDGKPQEWIVEQDRLSETIRTKVPFAIGRRNASSNFKGLVDEVRVYPRALSETEVAALSGADLITPLLAIAEGERTTEETSVLRQHFLTTIDETFKQLSKTIAEKESQITSLTKPYVNVMVMQDVPEMRQTYILERGNYASPLKDRPVSPGVPSALPALADGVEANRLGLAKWLTSPEHPLVARVTVNRYWSQLFGQGIVKTVEDFGAQGDWPTHPALLDWLAVDFVENGWDVKRTIKQMVMSSTYRQSSRISPKHLEADPENQLLARGPRFRLQAEFIRDSALAASGLLVSEVGGPGVKPYQPPGLWNEVSLNGNLRFVQDSGEKLYRRSLYTYWKRSSPAPSMTTFDAPTRETCTLRRARTNTPLQALVTLNDQQFVEAARVLAENAIHQSEKNLEEQIVFAYRSVTGTHPSQKTINILRDAYHQELVQFQASLPAAESLLKIGPAKRDVSIDAAQHAAMTIITSMIFNLDETLTRG